MKLHIMGNFVKGSLVGLLLVPGFVCSAQTHPARVNEGIKSTEFLRGDSAEATRVLKENLPKKFNDASLPRFAVFGKEEKFYLGIGAQIKLTAGFDAGDVIDNPNYFTTSALPMNPTPGNGARFKMSAQQSSISLNFVGLPGTDNQIGAFVGINFLGNNYCPNLSQAYLKYRGFTAGYAYTLFADMPALSPTIDYEGPNALTAVPHGVLQYEHSFGNAKQWTVGAALEQPTESYTTSSNTATVTQRVPDVPVYVQYSWSGGNGWLRLSGIVRNLYYRDLNSSKNVDKVGWGVKVSGSTPIVGNLRGYYQAVYGKGVGSYIQDLNGLGYDLAPAADNSGKLDAVKAWGAYAGLQYNFSKKVFASATYSHVRTYIDKYSGGSVLWDNQYKYAQYLVANVFWNVNSIIQTGVEYLYGRRVNYNGAQAHDNRIQAMVALNF